MGETGYLKCFFPLGEYLEMLLGNILNNIKMQYRRYCCKRLSSHLHPDIHAAEYKFSEVKFNSHGLIIIYIGVPSGLIMLPTNKPRTMLIT